MPIVGGSHEWTIAVAYALFMAASGFVLMPDQTHALNQLPSSMNADCSAVMNAIQQLAGAIVLATGGVHHADSQGEVAAVTAVAEATRSVPAIAAHVISTLRSVLAIRVARSAGPGAMPNVATMPVSFNASMVCGSRVTVPPMAIVGFPCDCASFAMPLGTLPYGV